MDVLRSLRDNGLRRAFLYWDVEAVVQGMKNRGIDGMNPPTDTYSWSRTHFRRRGDAEAIRIISARRTRRQIDFSDIPDSSAEQLKAMRRVGRPLLGDEPRQLIAIRVDAGVLDQFRKEARRRRVGYQILINEVLARHAGKDVA